jgi:tRNA 2-thiouridine synthesizing protein C
MENTAPGDRRGPKKFMLVNRRAPHGSIYALESLEVVLIAATFDQDVSLAFLDDGVFSLVKNQRAAAVEMKNFAPMYRALEDYDVNKLYVERESLQARGLSAADLLVEVEVLDHEELGRRMAEQDVVLSF